MYINIVEKNIEQKAIIHNENDNCLVILNNSLQQDIKINALRMAIKKILG